MYKLIFSISFLLFTATSFSQEVLFFGSYKKADAGKQYTCLDREKETAVFTSLEEAQQKEKDFRAAHAKYEPITKVFLTGSVVIYEFQYKWESFNCSVRSYTWEKAGDLQAARKRMAIAGNNKQTDKKEIFYWESRGATQPSANNARESKVNIRGVNVTYKVIVGSAGEIMNAIAIINNPRTDSAAHVAFIIDGKQQKQTYTIPPGGKANLPLGRLKDLEILLRPVKTEAEEELGWIREIKQYMRKKLIKNGKGYQTDGAGFGPRG